MMPRAKTEAKPKATPKPKKMTRATALKLPILECPIGVADGHGMPGGCPGALQMSGITTVGELVQRIKANGPLRDVPGVGLKNTEALVEWVKEKGLIDEIPGELRT